MVFDEVTGSFSLNVYIPPEPENKDGRRRKEEDWVTVSLEIPVRYQGILLQHLLRAGAYTVRVVRRDGRFDCFISFPLGDDVSVNKDLPMAGIDLNPDVVAVTVALPDGNFHISRCFRCPELVYISHEKREWMAGNLAVELAKWLESLGIKQVALEELSFAQDHDTNRLFNRLTHNFCKKLLFDRIVAALRKRGIPVFTVSARFTSLIGYLKYSPNYGLSPHQAAAFVIARRALGFAEKVPKEILNRLSPKEGWQHFKLWGKLSGLFRAARKRVVRNGHMILGWNPEEWLSFMFGNSS